MSNPSNQRIFSVVLISIFAVAVFLSIMLSKDNVDQAEANSRLEVNSQPVTELIERPLAGVETAKETQDGRKLLINTASASEIASKLKGIGEKTAQLIVAHRNRVGFYKNFEELGAVKNIGPAKIEANRDRISFD